MSTIDLNQESQQAMQAESAVVRSNAREYEAPCLQRHPDLPAITAVQSCDFFSADDCS